jgi:hypothetical protein
MCVHGLEDRRGADQVFATRKGTTYHLARDCNVMRVPRAMALGDGRGNSRLLAMDRASAKRRGLEPCRVCAGAARVWRT